MNFVISLKNWWNGVGKPRGHYGWKPSPPDHRDLPFLVGDVINVVILPSKVDLSSPTDPVYDQGELGSCTANAIAGAMEFDLKKQSEPDFMPSRLFIYYNERDMEGTVNSDAGAFIRDGIKSVNTQGVCHETTWPYDITKYAIKPTDGAYTEAKNTVSVKYRRIFNNLIPSDMKLCLASGVPFVFGFTVYQSFESAVVAKTGVVPMPSKDESILGGHAVLCVGYNDETKLFKCRNSWSVNWGDKGYFYMPYDYLTNPNLCDDFWTIQVIS